MAPLLFYVNGKEIIDDNVEPDWTLLWYLRNKLRLTGSKLGCGEGGCGACTVLISRCINKESNELEHRTINACLAPICSIDGCHVITVEGIGSVNKSNLHPIQTRLAELSGSQCGYCTPGMIMSLYGILTSKDNQFPSMRDIEESFDGNLCRCTGYRPILDAAKSFANDFDELNHHDEKSSTTTTTYDKCLSYAQKDSSSFNRIEFPEKLRQYTPQSLHIKGSIEWYRPITLKELLDLRQTYPGDQSRLVSGNTTLQIQRKFQDLHCTRLISIALIEELQEFQQKEDFLYIGSNITFARLKTKLIQLNSQHPFVRAFLDQLKYFASTQIRNIASIGGNIIAASPDSDINPLLLAADAILHLRRADQHDSRKIQLADFYLGDHRLSMEDNEVLIGVEIPLRKCSNRIFFRSYKQARRRDDSKGIITAAFQLELEQADDNDQQWKIVSIRLAFSRMSSKTILATNTEKQLIGLVWNKQTLNQAYQFLIEEMPLNENTHGGLIQLRRTLIQSFLFKFYSYVLNELRQTSTESNVPSFDRPISDAQQTIPPRPSSQKIVGNSYPHRSGYLHATGEATFVDDIPSFVNTLHAALVLSTKANARIKHIDIEAASKVAGFVSFVSAIDVPGSNKTTGALPDEEVFVSTTALCIGATIGLVVCQTEQAANLAAKLVRIDYEQLSPTIFSIEDAIKYESYFDDEIILRSGNAEESFTNAPHILEDILFIGGQEHFYMETNSAIVIPSNDDGEITIYVGTQNPTSVQELTALALNRDVGQIKCHVKRVGGGFGGKESRCLPSCLALAVAAVKVGCPVRLNLERHTDISTTGHRHPFKVQYKIAFDDEGRFLGLDIRMWNNAGCTLDTSRAVMQLSMLHLGNTYHFPNITIRGRVCKTHLPSNTAFRGFGGPQAQLACETIVEHVAAYLKRDPFLIRSLNLFKEGDKTHYGQVLEHWNVPRILDELVKSSDFIQRQTFVKEFNDQNKYRKRGISLIPNKFGIGFAVQFLNQAGALVHIYKDGSVVLSHGGIELGQALHTKMILIAAEVLGCHIDRIRISETATDKSHNISPTGGSVSSDLNGMAIQDACQQLRQRLDTVIDENNKDISWEDLVKKAYFARLDLCARGFYTTPNMFDADFSQNRAKYNYFTQGAAVTEVELDVLTGDWYLLRVDILMDVGSSLNPQIDIGQIEGGFMQGIGLYTMEELIWGDHTQNKWIEPGKLFTTGPDTYKIPSFSDVPIDFRVSLLSNSSNPRAIYSSKGIGEPPLLLGSSVFFALKQACTAYREQQGSHDYFTLHSPATVERLRMACADEFTLRACQNEHDYQTFQPTGSF